MKKMGKFERQARRQEYMTAIGILTVMREHLENNNMAAMEHFLDTWDQLYTEWLEKLDTEEGR